MLNLKIIKKLIKKELIIMKLIEEGFLQRNKVVLIIALALFIFPAFLGAAVTYQNMGSNYGMISQNLYHLSQTGHPSPIQGVDGVEIFFHNLSVDLMVVLGGFLFSIISVLLVVYNGFIIGAPFGTDVLFASVSILPHSIIEYPTSIFTLAAAFNITLPEVKMIKNRAFKSVLEENKVMLKDILALVIISVIFLIVAAFIEGNLTVPIVNWVYGF